MKNIIIACGVVGVVLAGCGNHVSESKLPSVVVNTVKSKYSSSDKIEWEKRSNGYEAEVKSGTNETKVLVDASGNIVMQKQEISKDSLPVAITDVINSTYKDYTLDEAERIEKAGVIYYQVELDGKGSTKDLELVFDANGKPAAGIDYWK